MRDIQEQPPSAQVISNPFPAPTPTNNAAVQSSTSTGATDLQSGIAGSTTPPSAAADNDLIEKSWVDMVNKLAQEYGDDPFVLQQKQAELTRDYLKKRFGRDIKAA